MKTLLIFLGALAAYGTDCTISDTVRTPFGGYFAGRIVVALNSPGSAQPLYSGSQTLTGWQTTIEVPSTANGVVAFTLVCTDTITPSGTSYSARYQPTSGSPWSETWNPTTGTTTIRAIRATTVPTPTTTFQASQLALAAGSMVYGSSAGVGTALAAGSNGQVLTLSGGYPSWSAVAACSTCVVTSGSYADPAWITSLAGSKVSGAVASATLAASATALATPRTIAGVSFNGTANISIPSTGLSDTANIVRNNAANTYTAGSKQTFAHSATTAGLNVGVQAAAPSSPAQGDVFFNTTLTRKGVYDGTQWRYELYAPSSGTGVVSWDGTSLSASTTLAGLASVTSTSFTGALTGNASTATALASTVASGRIWYGNGTGAPGTSSVFIWDSTNDWLGIGTTPAAKLDIKSTTSLAGPILKIRSDFAASGRWASIQFGDQSQLSTYQKGAIIYESVATSSRGRFHIALNNDDTSTSVALADARLTVNSNGNLLIGTTTDGNYKLDVQNSGSSGTLRVYDQTATTGNTKEVIRAGAGQTTNLTEWQNNAGTVLVSVANTGIFSANRISITSDRIDIPLGTSSGLGVAFSGGVSIRGNGTDSVLLVNSAGTGYGLLQFGGTTSSFPALKRSSAILQARLADDSAYTDIGVNAVIVNKAAPSASSDACTAGQLWAGDMGGTKYAFYCVASGTIVRSAFASF